MMLTEQEAKIKRCQESFGDRLTSKDGQIMNVPGIASAGSYPKVSSPSFCIGSACMAWRWQDGASPAEMRGTYGYCGKAGRP